MGHPRSESMPSLGELSSGLQENEARLRQVFANCSDVIFRKLCSQAEEAQAETLLIYLDGLTNTAELEQVILKPLVYEMERSNRQGQTYVQEAIRTGQLAAAHITVNSDLNEIVEGILTGKAALMTQGEAIAILADFNDFPKRSVEEPALEASIRGPREGFTEVLRTNTSLIRRKLATPLLKMESIRLGSISSTGIVIVYLEGTASSSLVEEVRSRLKRVQVKSVLDSSYLEEYLEDQKYSPFPQIQNTERPDTVAASLLEGKVAIIVNGSPNVLLAPMTFWNGFQAAEDHYEKFWYVSAVRLIRFILFMMSLLLPSFYVALTTYHPQMIPVALMMSISSAREGVPFPTVVETLMMEIMFEGLREAGLRLPRAIGSAVSIVGALVIGEAAVQAGFISAPIVIIVASTGIASFSIPRYSMSLPFRLLRFPLLVLSGTFGFFGIGAGVIAILIHLCTLESFKVPYFTPFAPLHLKQLKDTIIRAPKERQES
ncbi:spore germination protein [Paenibacillus lignilyticus]|uniref:Spore germination protein n=1 Tax=Paenibacillus lignilyticus TaxID=1172615 RepID=A0ABS5CKX4_9BACL|nr:spore germination protein [Paenibacillus lignilyticus]MBP3966507.1 spore germination protein [Paenibacillus lignilyticus]